MDIRGRDFSDEFVFQASRSSGPGGQNVNKVSSKVELRFNIANSTLLTDDEKALITTKLCTKINKVGELILIAQTARSQFKNKEKVIAKFYMLIEMALTPRKKRINTRPTKASVEKRLEYKRVKSQLKANRKNISM
jgi:ribosome-associated protein